MNTSNTATLILVCAGAFAIALGALFLAKGQALPVYVSEDAVRELDQRLSKLPSPANTYAWNEELPSLETSHKALADGGRGLIALGLGLVSSAVLLAAFARLGWMRSYWTLDVIWTLLWALLIPAEAWYIIRRYERGDFPSWADSYGMSILGGSLFAIVGYFATLLTLTQMRKTYPMTVQLRFEKPQTLGGWLRVAFLGLWLLVNALFTYSGVLNGFEGVAFSCTVASTILLIYLATPVRQAPVPTVFPTSGAAAV